MQRPQPPLFWVMTANLGGQLWMDWPARKKLAKKVLRRCPVSLVGFQEFGLTNWKTLKKAHRDLSLVRGEQLGDIFVNSVAFLEDRFAILNSRTFWLSDDGSRKRGWDGSIRGATMLLIRDYQYRSGSAFRDFLMVNFHLDNMGQVARTEGIKAIIREINGQEAYFKNQPGNSGRSLPVILTGDSNVSAFSPFTRWKEESEQDPGKQSRSWADAEMRAPYELMLQAGFTDCWMQSHQNPDEPLTRPMTYHAFQGRHYKGSDGYGTYDPDWIMVKGFKILNCQVIDDHEGGVYPSDHYWMMALLDYEN